MADAAVEAAVLDPCVVVVGVISAPLSSDSVRMLASWKEVPVIAEADAGVSSTLAPAVELFRRSGHPASRRLLIGDVGSGTTMFAAWQHLRPGEPRLERWLGTWATPVG